MCSLLICLLSPPPRSSHWSFLLLQTLWLRFPENIWIGWGSLEISEEWLGYVSSNILLRLFDSKTSELILWGLINSVKMLFHTCFKCQHRAMVFFPCVSSDITEKGWSALCCSGLSTSVFCFTISGYQVNLVAVFHHTHISHISFWE